MIKSLVEFINQLWNKKIMGGKHRPEKQLLTTKTSGFTAPERREFEKGYRELINSGLILRQKKRTGKGDEWHISLNPSKIAEIQDLINKGIGDIQ